MSIAFVLTIFILLSLIYYRSFRQSKIKNKRPPPALFRGALPVFGHMFNAIGKNKNLWTFIESVVEDIRKNNEDATTIKLGIWTVHGISNPEDCVTVANTCLQRVPYGFAKFWLGEGLLTAPMPIWKKHRKLLNHALNQKVLNGFLSIFNKDSKRLVESFRSKSGGECFDPSSYIRTITLDTICSTAMGNNDENLFDLKKSYVDGLHTALDILMKRIANFWMHNEYIYSMTKLKKLQDAVYKDIAVLNERILKERLNQTKVNLENTGQDNFEPFMDILLKLFIDGKISNEHIQDHVNTMVAAGYDTTSSTTLILLVAIGSYPDVQEKIYQELQEVFGDSNRDVNKDDITRLKYMDAAIKETMRLYPIVPLIFRILDRNVDIKHHTLPAGDICCISIYAANRHPVWGPDSEEFIPERWLAPGRVHSSYLATFSYGKRGCIGTTYAMMSMKTSLVHILRHYRLKSDVTKLKFKMDILATPVEGHFIGLEVGLELKFIDGVFKFVLQVLTNDSKNIFIMYQYPSFMKYDIGNTISKHAVNHGGEILHTVTQKH